MKKILLGIVAVTFLFTACTSESDENIIDEQSISLDEDNFFSRKSAEQCGTNEALNLNLEKNPELQLDYDAVEAFTRKALKDGSSSRLAADGSIIIPVVYHVIYRTQSQNLPLSVLQDQLVALNEDFNLNNPNRGGIPEEFQSVEANINISFELEQVIRVQNSNRRWRPDDSMKFSSSGGSDVVNPEQFLNVWIVNTMPYRGGQILGYAQFPGGDRATDGIVLASSFVGLDDRTATHEVGHYLNLRHIWGDGGCSVDDFVADTPVSGGANTGCPSYPDVSCGSADMTMNYMDYTNDPCMYMFTEGQKQRMLTVFAQGGFREAMAQ